LLQHLKTPQFAVDQPPGTQGWNPTQVKAVELIGQQGSDRRQSHHLSMA
jgi:hypothetical protein